ESMADAASSVVDYFDGRLLYINVLKNMSVDCDCCAVAEDPCIADIGILASTDPVAIDQACVDLVYACSDPGRPHLIERIESRRGIHTIEAAAELGLGTREYELVEV
ncbi:MAG: ferredoxin, partial [Clostridia bacterium]|nr:ferredoxin [Clostridia bacterium]